MFATTGNPDKPPVEQLVQHFATADAPDGFDFGARHGLAIGDNGQCLQRRTRQPLGWRQVVKLSQPAGKLGPGPQLEAARHGLDLKGPARLVIVAVELSDQSPRLSPIFQPGQLREPAAAERCPGKEQDSFHTLAKLVLFDLHAVWLLTRDGATVKVSGKCHGWHETPAHAMNDSQTTTAASDENLKLPKRKSWLGRVGCVTALVLVIAVPVGLLFLSGYSLVTGEEFSPQTFESRRFVYYRLPWFGVPFSKRTVLDSTSVPQQLLLSDGLVNDPGGEPRWDLVSDNWQPEHSADFDAAILVNYIRMEGAEGESFWPAWNDTNPGHAGVFWPLVAELARENLCLALPALFRLAMEIEDGKPDEPVFAQNLFAAAADEVRLLAAAERGAGDTARADQLEQLAAEFEQGPPPIRLPVP